jgi:hypothetical protein
MSFALPVFSGRSRLIDCNTNAPGERILEQTLEDMVQNKGARFLRIGGL